MQRRFAYAGPMPGPNEPAAALREASDREYSESLARGIAVLVAFNQDRPQQSLSDVARLVDLPKATVRRALNTFLRLGYVEKDGRLYRLTPKVLSFATAYLSSNGIAVVAQPICERISHQVGETSAMAIRDGRDALIVAKDEPRAMMSTLPAVGYRLPLVSSSIGRVMLASLPDDQLEGFVNAAPIVAMTPYTITDPQAVRDAVLEVRRSGYAVADQEVELGLRSISVPVRHFSGATVGALHIGGRVERCPMDRVLTEFLPVLQDAAREVSARLTGTSP